MQFDPTSHSHRRYNPLIREYVMVSPHRTKRPWKGQIEAPERPQLLHYDPDCYLCPGNKRATGAVQPNYANTFVFENDYASVLPGPAPDPPVSPHPLLITEPITGACDVLIFHPRHDLSLALLTPADISPIIEEWINIYRRRGAQPDVSYVQIFENRGAIMGCSNPHPHGQVWSTSSIPTIPAAELQSLSAYSREEHPSINSPKGPKGKPCLLCDYAHVELDLQDRVILKNDHWVALVPWWAIWPFEILLLPYRRHIPSLVHLTHDEKASFADLLSKVTIKYDNLFQVSFAYSMGIHQRPTPPAEQSTVIEDEDEDNVAHLHLHFTPPLLRSATVKKFLVGYELMAEAQRDLTPEQAATRLRDLSEIHYLSQGETQK